MGVVVAVVAVLIKSYEARGKERKCMNEVSMWRLE